jgi:cell division FtsZ-interacting protein ZapD
MDEQQRELIAVEVFKRTGIALSADDPVFVVAELCKQIIKEDTELYIDKQQAVLKAIREVPGAISEAVEVVAQAVERAEIISSELAEIAVQKARAEATEAISTALAAHLNGANEGLAKLERRLAKASDSVRDEKSFRLNMVLGCSLLLCAISLPVSMYLQNSAQAKAQQEAAYYLREIANLERSIEQLPPMLREKIKQSAKP